MTLARLLCQCHPHSYANWAFQMAFNFK